MQSRDKILSDIRQALSDRPEIDLPPMPDLWPETDQTPDELLDQFRTELEALSGELIVCSDADDARTRFVALLEALGDDTSKLGAFDSPAIRYLLKPVDADRIEWGQTDAAQPEKLAKELESLVAGVVPAEYLLADTGSCMVRCMTAHERLMCYLPPTCIVLASKERIREHLQAAWGDVTKDARSGASQGEMLTITGPSRTADIEKVLILGVHGPKRLIVLVV